MICDLTSILLFSSIFINIIFSHLPIYIIGEILISIHLRDEIVILLIICHILVVVYLLKKSSYYDKYNLFSVTFLKTKENPKNSLDFYFGNLNSQKITFKKLDAILKIIIR
jgi:hypothetical protein